MVAGSVLGAILAMMRRPRQKNVDLPGFKSNMRRIYSRHAPDRMLRGVSRTVSGIIKKGSK